MANFSFGSPYVRTRAINWTKSFSFDGEEGEEEEKQNPW